MVNKAEEDNSRQVWGGGEEENSLTTRLETGAVREREKERERETEIKERQKKERQRRERDRKER